MFSLWTGLVYLCDALDHPQLYYLCTSNLSYVEESVYNIGSLLMNRSQRTGLSFICLRRQSGWFKVPQKYISDIGTPTTGQKGPPPPPPIGDSARGRTEFKFVYRENVKMNTSEYIASGRSEA